MNFHPHFAVAYCAFVSADSVCCVPTASHPCRSIPSPCPSLGCKIRARKSGRERRKAAGPCAGSPRSTRRSRSPRAPRRCRPARRLRSAGRRSTPPACSGPAGPRSGGPGISASGNCCPCERRRPAAIPPSPPRRRRRFLRPAGRIPASRTRARFAIVPIATAPSEMRIDFLWIHVQG